MAQFTEEVFDTGLLNTRFSVSNRTVKKKDKGMVYRIFHLGDRTPTSDDELQVVAHSRDLPNSDSDISDDDQAHPHPMAEKQATQDQKRKTIFNVGVEESSDYESDDEPKKQPSISLFKDFLSLSRKKAEPVGSNSPQASVFGRASVGSLKEPEEPKRTESNGFFGRKKSTSVTRDFKSNEQVSKLIPPLARIPSIGESNSPKSNLSRTSSEQSFEEKYGNTEGVLGKGSFATVKLCCPLNSKVKFAVKEFRKKRRDESMRDYIKKLNAEFCIASSLDNENVVKSVDLIQDAHKSWCVVMEYCQGGDLFQRISNGSLVDQCERNCFFRQLCNGVSYLHSVGVAHRDLKPENLLVDASGHILKITDFGVSTVFKSPFATIKEKRSGVAGSGPYIAPEEFIQSEYEAEPVDVWSIGIIGYVMNTNSIPWRTAQMSDVRYAMYHNSQKYAPLERINANIRTILYKAIEPDPTKRLTLGEMLKDPWMLSIDLCTSGNDGKLHTHVSHGKL